MITLVRNTTNFVMTVIILRNNFLDSGQCLLLADSGLYLAVRPDRHAFVRVFCHPHCPFQKSRIPDLAGTGISGHYKRKKCGGYKYTSNMRNHWKLQMGSGSANTALSFSTLLQTDLAKSRLRFLMAFDMIAAPSSPPQKKLSLT